MGKLSRFRALHPEEETKAETRKSKGDQQEVHNNEEEQDGTRVIICPAVKVTALQFQQFRARGVKEEQCSFPPPD